MASPLPGVVATTASPATPASSAAARPGATPFVRTSAAVFAAFVLIQLIEYGALSIYLPLLKVTRLTTLLSYGLMAMMIIRYKGEVFASRQAKLFGTFVVFTAVGILWAVVRSYVPLALRYHVDYFGLFIITSFIVDSPRRARVLGLAFAAITVLLVVTNRNMFGQEIRFGSFAAAYFMGDGNDFGWGLIVMLPFLLYLMVGRRPLLIRAIGAVGLLFNLVGIVGTESRGATIALVGCILLFWATVARRKLLFVGVAAAGLIAVMLLAPPAYFARMNTLKNVDDDNSAQGRLR
ncbi:MAG: O-antigen ligase family protein, partial [Vicinamibacteria bacterium]